MLKELSEDEKEWIMGQIDHERQNSAKTDRAREIDCWEPEHFDMDPEYLETLYVLRNKLVRSEDREGMSTQKRSEFVKHLNRLAMILGLDVVYSVGFDDVDKSGIPNARYSEGLECVTFAWLPDFCNYSNDTLEQYVKMAKQKFGDYEDGPIKNVINEAEDFFLAL